MPQLADVLTVGMLLFTLAFLVVQLRTGIAFSGGTRGCSFIERSRQPGHFWFLILLDIVMAALVPALRWLAM